MNKSATNIFFGIVTAILIGVLGWIGKNVSDSNDRLARIETSMPYIQSAMADLKITVDQLRVSAATRTEVDTKILDLRTELAKLTTAQQRFELDLIRMHSLQSLQSIQKAN